MLSPFIRSLSLFHLAAVAGCLVPSAAGFLLAQTPQQLSRTTARMSPPNNPVAAEAREARLFRRTPLIHSPTLSKACRKDVYLKLDCLQPSGSFKDRGMAHLCWTLKQRGCEKLISSSGGNAGLAAATVGQRLGMRVRVVVPTTTKPMVAERLESLGAHVTIHGENWNAADTLAREWAAQDEQASYVSPYDDPLLWTGHSTLVDEIVEDLDQGEARIGALIVSVGGGGLLCGVLEGLERQRPPSATSSSPKTKVIAAETDGAASFGKALERGAPVRLSSIDTIATSLGALEVTPVVLERAMAHGHVQSALCTDAEAVHACLELAKDHRVLVEPACGAALAVAYSDRLREKYLMDESIVGPIVIQVCGGSGVNLELLAQWKQDFNL